MFRRVKKATLLLVAMAAAGVPLITTAACDPYRGTLSIFRDDDYYDRDFGFLDFFIDDGYHYSDCWYDCGYDYWYEDVVYFPW
jgi:hypothetical protein